MLLAEIAGGRCHDRAFRHHQLPASLNRHPHVFLTDEIERHLVWASCVATAKEWTFIGWLDRATHIGWAGAAPQGDRLRVASVRFKTARPEEFVNPAG